MREKRVTRTIKQKKIEAKGVFIDKPDKLETITTWYPASMTDSRIKKQLEQDFNFKPLIVETIDEKEELRYMLEKDFIKMSNIVDKITESEEPTDAEPRKEGE